MTNYQKDMDKETPSFLTFRQAETVIGLVTALITTPAVFYFFRKAVVDPCEGEYFLINMPLWVLFFLVIFCAVIGITRFARNERRHIGTLGNFGRMGHLSFLLPCLVLPTIMLGNASFVVIGLIILLSLVLTFVLPRQPRIIYLALIAGHTILGGVVLFAVMFIYVTALICWF